MQSTSARQRGRARSAYALAAAVAGMLAIQAPLATAGVINWVPTTTGSWATDTNWSPATIPNNTADTPSFSDASAARTISLDGSYTVGGLSVNNNTNFANTLNNNTSGSTARLLTLDAGGAGVTVTVNGSGTGNFTISATTSFNDNVTAVVNQTSQSSTAGALNWTGGVSGGSGGFTKQGPGLLTFGTAAKQYTGPTVLDTDSGRTRISVAGSPTKTSSLTVKSGAQITMTGANGTATWGTGSLYLNGTGIAAFPGVIRNDTNAIYTITNPVVLQSDSLIHVQGSATGLTTLSGGVSGVGALTLTAVPSDGNIGALALTGPGSYTGATIINAGTLRLGATGAAAAGGTSSITAHTNSFGARGVIQIEANNQINDVATITLDAATINTLGNSEGGFDTLTGKGVAGVGALTVTGNGILDLGSGASILAFANSSGSTWTGPLSVYNWTGNPDTGAGTDRLFFGSNAGGLTPAQLAQITFFSDAGATPVGTSTYQLSTGEVIPVVNGVPEPTSLALIGLGALGVLGRRRRHETPV